jgi:metal-responsive CopG/Arc/MetJ family transcriptional regulator
MRVKTSITLREETLRALHRVTRRGPNRSRAIEQAIEEFIARREREEREARDLAILNGSEEALNKEVADVLGYQAKI